MSEHCQPRGLFCSGVSFSLVFVHLQLLSAQGQASWKQEDKPVLHLGFPPRVSQPIHPNGFMKWEPSSRCGDNKCSLCVFQHTPPPPLDAWARNNFGEFRSFIQTDRREERGRGKVNYTNVYKRRQLQHQAWMCLYHGLDLLNWSYINLVSSVLSLIHILRNTCQKTEGQTNHWRFTFRNMQSCRDSCLAHVYPPRSSMICLRLETSKHVLLLTVCGEMPRFQIYLFFIILGNTNLCLLFFYNKRDRISQTNKATDVKYGISFCWAYKPHTCCKKR